MEIHKGESSMMGGSKAPISPGLREEMDKNQNWVVEVYRGKGVTEPSMEEEEDILELNLEDEEGEIEGKFLAFAVFFSQKSYNPQILFSDMQNAWGIKTLLAIENESPLMSPRGG
jgi:hypothetical protein